METADTVPAVGTLLHHLTGDVLAEYTSWLEASHVAKLFCTGSSVLIHNLEQSCAYFVVKTSNTIHTEEVLRETGCLSRLKNLYHLSISSTTADGDARRSVLSGPEYQTLSTSAIHLLRFDNSTILPWIHRLKSLDIGQSDKVMRDFLSANLTRLCEKLARLSLGTSCADLERGPSNRVLYKTCARGRVQSENQFFAKYCHDLVLLHIADICIFDLTLEPTTFQYSSLTSLTLSIFEQQDEALLNQNWLPQSLTLLSVCVCQRLNNVANRCNILTKTSYFNDIYVLPSSLTWLHLKTEIVSDPHTSASKLRKRLGWVRLATLPQNLLHLNVEGFDFQDTVEISFATVEPSIGFNRRAVYSHIEEVNVLAKRPNLKILLPAHILPEEYAISSTQRCYKDLFFTRFSFKEHAGLFLRHATVHWTSDFCIDANMIPVTVETLCITGNVLNNCDLDLTSFLQRLFLTAIDPHHVTKLVIDTWMEADSTARILLDLSLLVGTCPLLNLDTLDIEGQHVELAGHEWSFATCIKTMALNIVTPPLLETIIHSQGHFVNLAVLNLAIMTQSLDSRMFSLKELVVLRSLRLCVDAEFLLKLENSFLPHQLVSLRLKGYSASNNITGFQSQNEIDRRVGGFYGRLFSQLLPTKLRQLNVSIPFLIHTTDFYHVSRHMQVLTVAYSKILDDAPRIFADDPHRTTVDFVPPYLAHCTRLLFLYISSSKRGDDLHIMYQKYKPCM